jgi:hypothetical protein
MLFVTAQDIRISKTPPFTRSWPLAGKMPRPVSGLRIIGWCEILGEQVFRKLEQPSFHQRCMKRRKGTFLLLHPMGLAILATLQNAVRLIARSNSTVL